jgi:protein involved in polysaccharide export with SLBB domain
MVVFSSMILVAGLLSACSTSTSSNVSKHGENTAFFAAAPPPPAGDFQIKAGDVIDVKFYYHPDNNQDNLLVRPDGKILLALGGEIQAAGMTPNELAQKIAVRYATNLRDPQVSVNLKTQNQSRVFVGGEVAKPGFLPYRPGLTAVQALVEAGGWKDTANLQEVVLLQRIKEDSNEYRPTRIDLAKVVEQGNVTSDIVLTSSDVIVVPKSGIAKANVWVEQYIIKMIPIRISVSPI